MAYSEVTTQHERAEELAEGLRVEVERVRELNERLESDLSRVNAGGPGGAASSGLAAGEGDKKDKGLAGLDLGRTVDITWSTTRLAELICQDGASTPSQSAGADSSILPIVTSQRDRFRQRNAELEEVSCCQRFSPPRINATALFPSHALYLCAHGWRP